MMKVPLVSVAAPMTAHRTASSGTTHTMPTGMNTASA